MTYTEIFCIDAIEIGDDYTITDQKIRRAFIRKYGKNGSSVILRKCCACKYCDSERHSMFPALKKQYDKCFNANRIGCLKFNDSTWFHGTVNETLLLGHLEEEDNYFAL